MVDTPQQGLGAHSALQSFLGLRQVHFSCVSALTAGLDWTCQTPSRARQLGLGPHVTIHCLVAATLPLHVHRPLPECLHTPLICTLMLTPPRTQGPQQQSALHPCWLATPAAPSWRLSVLAAPPSARAGSGPRRCWSATTRAGRAVLCLRVSRGVAGASATCKGSLEIQACSLAQSP